MINASGSPPGLDPVPHKKYLIPRFFPLGINLFKLALIDLY